MHSTRSTLEIQTNNFLEDSTMIETMKTVFARSEKKLNQQ